MASPKSNLHWTFFDIRSVIELDTMNFQPKSLVFLLFFGFNGHSLARSEKISQPNRTVPAFHLPMVQ